MPSISSNIPSIIYYSFTTSEFVIIAGSVLLLKYFFPIEENRMINQSGSKHLLLKQIRKAFNGHPKAFQRYHIIASDIISKIAATWSVSDSKGLNKLVQFWVSNGPACNLTKSTLAGGLKLWF